jgi:hypothetical protein
MKVFLSWSGARSRQVAIALRDWLPSVINSVEPFVSAKDIYAGTRWQTEISAQLESTNFGIICVTEDNQSSAWLNFEAGALAKAVDASRVAPLAIDLKPSDVELPLGQFQAQPADEGGIMEICRSINVASPHPLDPGLLSKSVKKWWPDLEEALATASKSTPTVKGSGGRSDREILEEVLNTLRSLVHSSVRERRGSALDRGHPVASEIRAILDENGYADTVILFGSSRNLGIRGVHDDAVRDQIRERARTYAVEIDFLPSRRPRPVPTPDGPPEPETRATAEGNDQSLDSN